MTQIYTITIIGPISTTNSQLISYNEYPIICISKNNIQKIFTNKKLKDSIQNTISKMGTEHIQYARIHIRTISNDLKITDTEIPLQELVNKWTYKKQEKSTSKPVRILGNVNGHI